MQNGNNQTISPPLELNGRRVDLFITELYVGGAEKCLAELALFLKKQGASVRVFSLASLPSSPADSLVKKIRGADIEVHALGADRVWNAASAIIKLRKHLQDSPPDVLQSFLFHANMIASAALVGIRGRHQAETTRYIRWVAGVRVADPRKQRLALESLAFRRADRVVAVSEGSRNAYRSFSPIKSDKWLVIPNGVETEITNESPPEWESLGLPANAKVVLFVGRLEAQKGATWLIDTASDWLTQLPGHHLVIAGRGPQQTQLLQKLEGLQSESPNLKNRIHLVGWLDQPRRWMRQAEMLVLPAQYEGMPNVCLEAMAEGTPVVAFDVQGIRELLGEPSDGEVVPVQDRRVWAESIVKIATDTTLRKTISLRNRQKIESDFQLSSQLQKYVELYLGLERL
jgi:glycosyltransferase involved in cell wall biosynthesis